MWILFKHWWRGSALKVGQKSRAPQTVPQHQGINCKATQCHFHCRELSLFEISTNAPFEICSHDATNDSTRTVSGRPSKPLCPSHHCSSAVTAHAAASFCLREPSQPSRRLPRHPLESPLWALLSVAHKLNPQLTCEVKHLILILSARPFSEFIYLFIWIWHHPSPQRRR